MADPQASRLRFRGRLLRRTRGPIRDRGEGLGGRRLALTEPSRQRPGRFDVEGVEKDRAGGLVLERGGHRVQEEFRERHAGERAELWERYVTAERQELEGRKAGLVGRLLGRPLPSESGEDLRRFAEEDRERAGRGPVQLRLGERVWWKPLHELTPEDRPARLEAKRVFAGWLSDRRTARTAAISSGGHGP